MSTTLDVTICTYGKDGINRVARMDLPQIENIRYIVSWQNNQDQDIPEKLKRSDIEIYRCDTKGISNNRNNAISHCTGDIVYISDDDLTFPPDAFRSIIRRFEEYPDTQVATFKMAESLKTYPEGITDLGFYLPKGYNVGSCQIAFRREVFDYIKFDTRFGINSGIFEVGEDELFHLTARKIGLKCRFFPDIIASHPHESSGQRLIKDKRVLHGMGAIIAKSYPFTSMIRIPLKAIRLYKSQQASFADALLHLYKGWMKSFKI